MSKSSKEQINPQTPVVPKETITNGVLKIVNGSPDPGEAAEIKKKWEKTLITSEPQDEPALLRINGTPTASPGEHTLVSGQRKVRKTLFLVWYISQYQGDLEKDVLWFDLEQGKKHVWRIHERIKNLTGKNIPIFFLRGMSKLDRRAFIQQTIRHWPTKIKLVVVDGIRDAMKNINDINETDDVIVWLEQILVEFGVHVLNVLHLNKQDKTKGHLGEELGNKCQTFIRIEKDATTGISNVSDGGSRDEPFDGFSFTHDENGLPKITTVVKISGELMDEDEQRKRLKFVFEGRQLKRSELEQQIKDHFETKRPGPLIATFIRRAWVAKIGQDHSPNTRYQLMI